jgi:two-component system cell cycle sensor histidine kinase/response regulator CckA
MHTSLPLGILSRLCAALAGDEPERALREMLSLLGELGMVGQLPARGEPSILLEHAGRKLSLAIQVPDAATRAVVVNLLRAAFARTSEHDEQCRIHERMEMLSAASFEGIAVSVDGVIIDANRRLEEMFGYERSEMLGEHTWRRCVTPEDLPEVLRHMADRIAGEYMITGVRKDGSRFRAELASKQGQVGERPARVVAVRDVTERERTNAQLRESEARLHDLAEQAFDLIVLSRDGVIADVGGSIEDLLGFGPEQVVGRPLLDLVVPSGMATNVAIGERVGAFESVALSAHGEHIPVEVVGVLSTLHGQPVHVAGLRDLREARRLASERRKLEQQLERSQRLDSLGVLAGGIAHDFNNLLVAVLGNAELLIERLVDPDDLVAAEAIRAAGKRAANLTAQMLDYAGQRDLGGREPVDLLQLWQELRVLVAASLSKKAHLKLAVQPGSVVLGDRATITQVLMNLLSNASDALEDKAGTIEVRARRLQDPGARWESALGATVRPGAWLLLEVKDDGVGMDELTLGRAFEPFFSTKTKGHGLGLAACLGIVSSHGGAMLVDSAPGKGSCFSVLWPATEPVTLHPVESPSAAAGRPRKVLVVDDEPSVRSLVRRLLESRGYAVEEASGGREALALVEHVSADVMVVDVTMPDLDGIEVVNRVRAMGLSVPIVLSSGYLDVSAARGLDHGSFQGFVGKPYRLAELLETIERALQSANTRELA